MLGAAVKVVWRRNGSGQWYAILKLALNDGFRDVPLVPGREMEWEFTSRRRCTGYAPEKGERTPCPDFVEIDSGSQCGACRGKDIYSDYVRGDQRTELDGEFSVYLAQAGSKTKVGVTRSSKLERRWIEQGADYAAELRNGLEASKALEVENEIYRKGVLQRVRKEDKLERGGCRLEQRMEEHNLSGEVVDLEGRTIYPEPGCSRLKREGRFTGELESVKGQILSNGKVCIAVSSGKVLQRPSQKGIEDFQSR